MVYAYRGKRLDSRKRLDAAAALVALAQQQEARDDEGRARSLLTPQGQHAAHAFNERQAARGITASDVPY
jgi:hypothetical protein